MEFRRVLFRSVLSLPLALVLVFALFPLPSPAPATVAPIATAPAPEHPSVHHAAIQILEHALPPIRTTRINPQRLLMSLIRVHAERAEVQPERQVMTRQFLQPVRDIHVGALAAITARSESGTRPRLPRQHSSCRSSHRGPTHPGPRPGTAPRPT